MKRTRTIKLLNAFKLVTNSTEPDEGFEKDLYEAFYKYIVSDENVTIAEDGTIGLKEMYYLLKDSNKELDLRYLYSEYISIHEPTGKCYVTDTDIRMDIVDFYDMMNDVYYAMNKEFNWMF